VLTQRPVDRRLAMTGELTLRGDVLPIGGLKEKVLAAKLAGVSRVALPKLNRRDLDEVSQQVKQGLSFHFVEHMEEVLDLALLPVPRPTLDAPAARPAEESPPAEAPAQEKEPAAVSA
jgi:ATP-dependent Lon protease